MFVLAVDLFVFVVELRRERAYRGKSEKKKKKKRGRLDWKMMRMQRKN